MDLGPEFDAIYIPSNNPFRLQYINEDIQQVTKTSQRGILILQKRWIEFLNYISIKPPKLGRTQRDGATPGTRMEARDFYEYQPWQYRVVMHNELAYDIDIVDWDLLKIIVQPVINTLIRLNIPFLLAGSGGSKSLHIHIFFEPTVWGVRYSWKAVREALWHWILDEAQIPEGMRGAGCWEIDDYKTNYPFDTSPINFSDMAEGGKVIRDFGGTKDQIKRKTLIPYKLPDKREDIYASDYIVMPTMVKLWNANNIIERYLEFERRAPKSCSQCPVDPEWMLEHEPVLNVDRPPTYPRLCRECGLCFKE